VLPPSNLYLRLPLDIVCINKAKQVAVYSKSGAVLFDGHDARVVVDTVFPLLNGTRTEKELFALVPEIMPSDIMYVLQALSDNGLLEYCAEPESLIPPEEEISLQLQKAKIAICGAEPLLNLCVEAIKNAGVRQVTFGLNNNLELDLAVGVFYGREKPLLREFADVTNKMQIPSLACVIHEKEIFIGPFVAPGRTACWNCCDLRITANLTCDDPYSGSDDFAAKIAPDIGTLISKQVSEVLSKGDRDSRLIDHVLIFDRLSSDYSLHRILRVPGCKVCGGPRISPQPHDGDVYRLPIGSSLEFSLHALSLFVDSRTGIINQITIEGAADTGVELPFIATAITAKSPGEFGHQTTMPAGWGKGVTPSDAVIGALGEAIERYSASMPDPSSIVWSRPSDIEGEVLDPRMFALYGDDQYVRPDFPFVRFDPTVSHPWVAGVWAGTQKKVWVPAILAYLSIVLCSEHVFCQGTSNGLAAGTDWNEAALRAILELLERDSFITSWLSRKPGKHVLLDQGLDPDLKVIVSGISDLGGQVELVLLESICGYPTAVCLAFGDGVSWPGVTLGLGTDPNPRSAIRQAILEQGQTGPYLRRLMKKDANSSPMRAQNVTEMLHHATYYFPPERASAFDYLRDDSIVCSLADLPNNLERSLTACSRDLANSGVRVALVDVTSGDIAASPFRVIRALSPDLQPISFGFGLNRLLVPHLTRLGLSLPENRIVPIW